MVEIRRLRPDELHAAAALLAIGMRDNPLHASVFGAQPTSRQRRLLAFLRPLLAYLQSHGEIRGAFTGGKLVAVLGMIRPGACRPGLRDRLRFARAILPGMPPWVWLRIYRWLAVWARNDPDSPHWHIGPLAVLPVFRRQGIARTLMSDCCDDLDRQSAAGWLETDLKINADFYQSLGFVNAKRETVLGVPGWFMYRPPMCGPGGAASVKT